MSEKVKIKIDAKYTSFVLHIVTDAATHISENTNVEIDVSKLLHILHAVYLTLLFIFFWVLLLHTYRDNIIFASCKNIIQ
jgi:hypothetical protein